MDKSNIRQHQQRLDTKQSKFNDADLKERMAESSNENSNCNIQNVMCSYFRCRFFKNQTLTSEIFKAENENDARKQFKKRHRTLNLLECVPM